MKSKHFVTASVAALCSFTLLSPQVHAADLAYTATILNELPGFSFNDVGGINASGQVVGASYFASDASFHAIRWTGTTPEDLGTLGGSERVARSINASGQVAGYSLYDSVYHAVRWTGTTPAVLSTLGGTGSEAFGINHSGQVVGSSQILGNGASHAVRWTGTTPTDLGTIGNGNSSAGYGINDSGQVAGWSYTSGFSAVHAVRWTGTTPTDLGTLGGTSSRGTAINASGQVVGDFKTVNGNSAAVHAALWTGTTGTDLGTLGGNNSYAFGINAAGDIVGNSPLANGTGPQRAFLYTSGTMYDLNNLLVPGSGVTALSISIDGGNPINDLGQIAAFGTFGGQLRAIRLDPVPTPEPASAVLLLGGAALLGLRRRR